GWEGKGIRSGEVVLERDDSPVGLDDEWRHQFVRGDLWLSLGRSLGIDSLGVGSELAPVQQVELHVQSVSDGCLNLGDQENSSRRFEGVRLRAWQKLLGPPGFFQRVDLQ